MKYIKDDFTNEKAEKSWKGNAGVFIQDFRKLTKDEVVNALKMGYMAHFIFITEGASYYADVLRRGRFSKTKIDSYRKMYKHLCDKVDLVWVTRFSVDALLACYLKINNKEQADSWYEKYKLLDIEEFMVAAGAYPPALAHVWKSIRVQIEKDMWEESDMDKRLAAVGVTRNEDGGYVGIGRVVYDALMSHTQAAYLANESDENKEEAA